MYFTGILVSQHFVKPPFTAIIAEGLLGNVSTSFAHLEPAKKKKKSSFLVRSEGDSQQDLTLEFGPLCEDALISTMLLQLWLYLEGCCPILVPPSDHLS